MIGNFLDQYLITARLGSGSLGETYLAESVVNGRKVVLKLIDPELAAKPWLLEKITALSQRQASGVLPFTLETSEKRPYLLIPDYFTDNLQSYLTKLEMQKRAIETEQAIALILHLISRLHQINFTQLNVHGALHPRNMLVQFTDQTGAQTPKALILADFQQADWVRQATVNSAEPVRGLAPFTPPWLWVETESGQTTVLEADGRTDLFALGHLLYFLLKNTYLQVAKPDEDNEALNKQYEKVSDRIIRNEKGDKRELADYAELAALTAVRLYLNAPPQTTDSQLWQQWHHALLTMRRGDFSLTKLRDLAKEAEADEGTEAPKIDAIWHISEPLPFLTPDAPEAQLHLPALGNDEAADEVPLEVDPPSEDKTYITISRPGASSGDRQRESFYTLRANQGHITVGSHSGTDICLTRDAKIGPHHLDIRQVGERWELYARGSDILLNDTAVSPNQPEVWPPNTAVTIGSYCLRLHQPMAESADQQIEVKLLPPQLNLAQGVQGKVGITIRNNGAERAYFLVNVRDLGPLEQPEAHASQTDEAEQTTEWFELPKTGLVLNPGEQQDLFLKVHPHPREISQMRRYQIKVSRLDDNAQKKVVLGHIFLQAATDFATRLTAVSSQNDGAYRLIILNKSNKAQTYQVHSVDPLKALKFAKVDVFDDAPQAEEEPIAHEPRHTNGRARPNLLQNQLFNRVVRQAGGGQIMAEVATVRHQVRRGQTALGGVGSLVPKTNLTFPKTPKRLPFEESFFLEKSIPPGHQAVLFFKARPRKRPFRYQPHREIPFRLTISPTLGEAGKAQEETAVFHVTSRLSRPIWALLVGLLLFSCLLLTALTTFEASSAAGGFQATQEYASNFGRTDVEGDSLGSRVEVAAHTTNPELRDTDGDGLSDGFEVSLGDPRICPTKIDCNGNGIPDPVEIGFATPTPSPVASVPFIMAEPTPIPTAIPTVTPTSTAVAQSQPTRTASITFSRSDLELTLGDDRDNQPLTFTLTFNTASQLPANAIIHEAQFFVVLRNPEQYGRLQQELGNVYVTEGASANQQQLGQLAEGSPGSGQSMNLAYNTNNILLTTLPTLHPDDNGVVTVLLFFELGSDLDGQADLLQIWSNHDQQSSLEHPPTLQITYSLPGISP